MTSESGSDRFSQVALAWWEIRALLHDDLADEQTWLVDEQPLDFAEIMDLMDEMSADPGEFKQLLVALTVSAGSDEQLSSIGTGVLEDAYATMGARALAVLEDAVPDASVRARILAGFQF